MLDNIFDLVSDLIGENNVNQLTGKRLPGGDQMRKPVKQRPATSRPAVMVFSLFNYFPLPLLRESSFSRTSLSTTWPISR